MVKVSIIIPLFNKEKYIAKTLDSIVNQSFSDYEVIIVNDGSTDGSLSIVEQYQDKYPQITIINISNGGVSNARNIGLKNASGEWIQFLDGDDLINKNYLNVAVEIGERIDSDIVFSNFTMINENMQIIRRINSGEIGERTREQICDCFINLQNNNGFFGFISNKLFRRSIINGVDYAFDIRIKLAEDLDFFSRVYPLINKAVFINLDSFCYLQTEYNYKNDLEIDYFSQLVVRLNIKKWFQSVKKYEQYRIQLDELISRYVIFTLDSDYNRGILNESSFLRIVGNDEIMYSITPSEFKGFQRKVLNSVLKRDYKQVVLLYGCRDKMKRLYKKLLHREG